MNDKGMSSSPISRHSFSRSKALIIRAERERERKKEGKASPHLLLSPVFSRQTVNLLAPYISSISFSPGYFPGNRERESSLLVVFPQKSFKTFNCLFKRKRLEKLLITFQNSLAKSIFKPSLQKFKAKKRFKRTSLWVQLEID